MNVNWALKRVKGVEKDSPSPEEQVPGVSFCLHLLEIAIQLVICRGILAQSQLVENQALVVSKT